MSVVVNMQDKLIGVADKPLWQYDYGQTVTIQNVDIPDGAISVQFEAQQSGGAIATAGTCSAGVITADIPNQLLALPAVWNYKILAYVFVVTEDSGTTKYTAILEVAHRGAQTDEEPTPEQQSAWDQAMAELAEYQNAIDAQIGGFAEEITALEGALSEQIGLANNELFFFSDTAMVNEGLANGWRLNTTNDGFCHQDAEYKLLKYAVYSGDILKIVSDDRFQFQNSASVPSTGTSNRVGSTFGAGTYVMQVPTGATYLIVSTAIASPSNVYHLKTTLAEEFNEYVIKNLDTSEDEIVPNYNVNLVMDADGSTVTAGSNYFAVSDYIPVTAGDKYLLNCKMMYNNGVVAFYDDSDALVDIIRGNKGAVIATNTFQFENYVFEVPAGATKMRLGVYSTTGFAYLHVLDKIEYKIIGVMPDNMAYKTESIIFDFTENKIVNPTSGEIVTAGSTAYLLSDAIPVTAGEKYRFDATMLYNVGVLSFYDSSDGFIGCVPSNTGTVIGTNLFRLSDVIATVPSNAATMRFGYYVTRATNYHYKLEKIIGEELVASTRKWKGLKWVCVGDSLTEINTRTTKHYYDFVSEATGIEVVNMGVSGTGYGALAGQNEAFYQRVGSCPTDADVVTIFGSFNDLASGLPVGSATDSGTDTLAGCINTTITNLQTRIPLVNLGVVTPCPWDNTKPATSGTAHDYVEMIKAICELRSIPCLDLWHCSNLRPWESGFREIAYIHDGGAGTHPSEAGHKLLAPHFKNFLEELLL